MKRKKKKFGGLSRNSAKLILILFSALVSVFVFAGLGIAYGQTADAGTMFNKTAHYEHYYHGDGKYSYLSTPSQVRDSDGAWTPYIYSEDRANHIVTTNYTKYFFSKTGCSVTMQNHIDEITLHHTPKKNGVVANELAQVCQTEINRDRNTIQIIQFKETPENTFRIIYDITARDMEYTYEYIHTSGLADQPIGFATHCIGCTLTYDGTELNATRQYSDLEHAEVKLNSWYYDFKDEEHGASQYVEKDPVGHRGQDQINIEFLHPDLLSPQGNIVVDPTFTSEINPQTLNNEWQLLHINGPGEVCTNQGASHRITHGENAATGYWASGRTDDCIVTYLPLPTRDLDDLPDYYNITDIELSLQTRTVAVGTSVGAEYTLEIGLIPDPGTLGSDDAVVARMNNRAEMPTVFEKNFTLTGTPGWSTSTFSAVNATELFDDGHGLGAGGSFIYLGAILSKDGTRIVNGETKPGGWTFVQIQRNGLVSLSIDTEEKEVSTNNFRIVSSNADQAQIRWDIFPTFTDGTTTTSLATNYQVTNGVNITVTAPNGTNIVTNDNQTGNNSYRITTDRNPELFPLVCGEYTIHMSGSFIYVGVASQFQTYTADELEYSYSLPIKFFDCVDPTPPTPTLTATLNNDGSVRLGSAKHSGVNSMIFQQTLGNTIINRTVTDSLVSTTFTKGNWAAGQTKTFRALEKTPGGVESDWSNTVSITARKYPAPQLNVTLTAEGHLIVAPSYPTPTQPTPNATTGRYTCIGQGTPTAALQYTISTYEAFGQQFEISKSPQFGHGDSYTCLARWVNTFGSSDASNSVFVQASRPSSTIDFTGTIQDDGTLDFTMNYTDSGNPSADRWRYESSAGTQTAPGTNNLTSTDIQLDLSQWNTNNDPTLDVRIALGNVFGYSPWAEKIFTKVAPGPATFNIAQNNNGTVSVLNIQNNTENAVPPVNNMFLAWQVGPTLRGVDLPLNTTQYLIPADAFSYGQTLSIYIETEGTDTPGAVATSLTHTTSKDGPTAPTVQATLNDDGTVRVQATQTNTASPPVTYFEILDWIVGFRAPEYTTIQSGNTTIVHTIPKSAFTNGESLEVRVRVGSTSGTSPWSTTEVTKTAPSAPILTAERNGNTLTLTAHNVMNGSTPYTASRIHCSPGPDNYAQIFQGTIPGHVINVQAPSNWQYDQVLYCRWAEGNADGFGPWSNTVQFEKEYPGAPSISLSEFDTNHEVRATWTQGTAGEVATTKWQLQCRLNDGPFTLVHNGTAGTTVFDWLPAWQSNSDRLTCQARDGNPEVWGDWSPHTELIRGGAVFPTPILDPGDRLVQFEAMIQEYGGVYFGLGIFPFLTMFIGFLGGKNTVRIFTLAIMMIMGILHVTGYFTYPDWYWALAILFGIGLILGRQK